MKMTHRSRISAVVAVLLLCTAVFSSACGLSCALPSLAGHACCVGETSDATVVGAVHCHDVEIVRASSQDAAMACVQAAPVAFVTGGDRRVDLAGQGVVVGMAAGVLRRPVRMIGGGSRPPGVVGTRPLVVSLKV